jgi:hypothetical protein
MQMVFLDVPCEFLLRNSWPGLDYEKLKLQVHNDPTIEEYMNPQSLERLATTRYEEVQILRDVMEEKLWASIVQNNNRPLVQNNRPPQLESEDDDSSTTTTGCRKEYY